MGKKKAGVRSPTVGAAFDEVRPGSDLSVMCVRVALGAEAAPWRRRRRGRLSLEQGVGSGRGAL